jgi:hypothetical protein
MRDRPQGRELEELAARARHSDSTLALPDDARYRDAMVKRAEEIAARQRETGAVPERREHDSLLRLLGGNGDLLSLNRTLAAAIRSGRFDPGSMAAAAVYRHLWETALERVRESNPRALTALGS